MENYKITKNTIHQSHNPSLIQKVLPFLRLCSTIGVRSMVFLLLATAIPQQSHAQFWKKIFGGHHKEQKKENTNTKEEKEHTENKSSHRQKVMPEFPQTQRKNRYRIDVLLPLEINNYVSPNEAALPKTPAEIVPVINFYEGMRLAAEQLNKENIKIDLFVQDAGKNGNHTKALLQDTTLQQADLIIGFLQSEQLDGVAKLAEKKHINFFSAFSPSDADVTNNPYFVIMQPTLKSHIQKLTAYSEKHYSGSSPIFIYAENTPVQKEAKKFFENALNGRHWDSLSYEQFLRNPDLLAKFVDSSQTNVILVNLLSYKEAENILKKLNDLSSSIKFAVFGMPTWKYLPGLSGTNALYKNMDIYFSTPFYYDLQSTKGNALALNYKKEFGGVPSEMVFRGYESLYWTAHLLQAYGTIFNSKISNSRMAPFTRFDVTPSWSSKNKFLYFENKNLYIFHYVNGYFNVEE